MSCLNQNGPAKIYRPEESISSEDTQKAKACRDKLPEKRDYLAWFEKG